MKQVNLLFKTVLLIGLSWILMFGIVYSQKLNQARNWCTNFGNHLTFNSDNTLSIDSIKVAEADPLFIAANNAMSDSTGRMLYYLSFSPIAQYYGKDIFYSYAFVRNSKNELMENGDSLICESSRLFAAHSIPVPGRNGIYYLLTYSIGNGKKEEITNPYLPQIYYHIIDMNQNNGLGKVVVKNKLFSNLKAPILNTFTTVKHADGIRYWILAHGVESNIFYKWLAGPDGIDSIPHQVLGSPRGVREPNAEYGRISVNRLGNKIALCISVAIYTFDFDRCTGLVSNPVDHSRCVGPARKFGAGDFSPNSKYYYFPVNTSAIYQLPIDDTLKGRRELIKSKYERNYPILTLGPDDKMYIGLFSIDGKLDRFGVIDNPDEDGKACNLRPEGLIGPKLVYGSLPTFPNYDLGPEPPKIEYDTFRVCRKKQKIYSNALTIDTLNYRVEWVPNIGLTDNTIFSPGILREKDTITYTMRIFSRDFDCEKINRRVKVMFLRPSSEECSGSYVDPVVHMAPTVTIYPNPVKDLLTIVSNKIITKIRIFDLNSKQLATREPGDTGLNYELDVQDFPHGIYLLQVETDGGSVTQRVVVE